MQFRYWVLSIGSSLFASSSTALHLPVEQRAAPNLGCNNAGVVVVDGLLRLIPSPASSICSALIHRTAATVLVKTTKAATATVTITATATQSVPAVVDTVTGPPTTVTTTKTAMATVTVITTATQSVGTVVDTVTRPPTTVTTTPIVAKRATTTSKLGDVFPSCPPSLRTVALDFASAACSCFLGPITTTTVTVTAVGTTTKPATQTVTMPAATVTTSVDGPTTMVTVTVAGTTTKPVTEMVTTPATTVTTSVDGPTTTVTDVPTSTTQPPSCVPTTVWGTGVCGCLYQIFCDVSGGILAIPQVMDQRFSSFSSCLEECDNRDSCAQVDFDSVGRCHGGRSDGTTRPEPGTVFAKRLGCPSLCDVPDIFIP